MAIWLPLEKAKSIARHLDPELARRTMLQNLYNRTACVGVRAAHYLAMTGYMLFYGASWTASELKDWPMPWRKGLQIIGQNVTAVCCHRFSVTDVFLCPLNTFANALEAPTVLQGHKSAVHLISRLHTGLETFIPSQTELDLV